MEPALNAAVGIASANTGATPFCSGVLVGREFVITAAHCAELLLDTSLAWVLHGDEIKIWGAVSRIIALSIHPNYSGTGFNPIGGYRTILGRRNDIAILKIEPAPKKFFEVNVDFDSEKLENQNIIMVGWGREKSSTKRFGCVYGRYESQLLPTSRQFNFTYIDHGYACHGDSGGPVMYVNGTGLQLIGIVNGSGLRGISCGHKKKASVTRLSHYKDWFNCATDALADIQNLNCQNIKIHVMGL